MFRSNQFSYMLPKTILTFVAFIKYPGLCPAINK